ncbi:hypothetical protein DPPLL_30580 [Desulfofustis limnaeus]|uniref:Uncharacterized protein n=2 Tax=Desulfofustis limnaeus TaxID=2740163 RepID=A0ABM7WCG5_9BACT|nr:hypothetical protein DPPLL_30580 [Desulfofustis limnaeus]
MSGPLDSIVIGFGEGVVAGSALAVAELDEVRNRNADGTAKTEFGPREPFYFWVHHEPGLRIVSVRATGGNVSMVGQESRSRTLAWTFFPFADTSVELSHVPLGRPSALWYGRDGRLQVDGRRLTAAAVPAVGDISYSFRVTLFRVTPPAETGGLTNEQQRFPVGVAVLMGVA